MTIPNVIESLLPILSAVPGLNIFSGAGQTYFVLIAQKRMESIETSLRYEVNLLNQKLDAGKLKLDRDYISRGQFDAQFVQALRAYETAESNTKIGVVSRALISCLVTDYSGDFDKGQCMRLIGQMTERELEALSYIVTYSQRDVGKKTVSEEDILASESLAENSLTTPCHGLAQLGLIHNPTIGGWGGVENGIWMPTVLARQVIAFCNQIEE